MTGKHVSATELQRRLKIVHNGIVTLDENTYTKMGKKTKFIDSEFGEWWAKPGQKKKSIYFVDLFIKSGLFKNTYVEIKGTWARKNGHIGKKKWEWFHENFPNSELWMKHDLIAKGII